MPKIYIQSELRRIEQTIPPGTARQHALTELGERLVAAMTESSDLRERYRLRILHQHVMRRAHDERNTDDP